MRHRIVEGEPTVLPSPLSLLRKLGRKRSGRDPGERWTRLAAYTLCRDEAGRILLARVSSALPADAGRWTMPGGGVDWGEHPVDAARRELEEEAGLVADVGAVVGIFSHVFAANETIHGSPGHILGLIFSTTNITGELRHEASGTTDQAAWFTLDEARALPRVGLVSYVLDTCCD